MKQSIKTLFLVSFLSALTGCLLAWALYLGPGCLEGRRLAYGQERPPVRITDDRNAVIRAVKLISPAVVNIDTSSARKVTKSREFPAEKFFREFFGDSIPFNQYEEQIIPRKGKGSGVIISSDGYILTNDHVVRGADEILVTLSNKQQHKAVLKGADRVSDIAILKIEAKSLPVAKLGDSDRAEVGEWVIAVGNPYGYDHTVTAGVISGRGRNLSDGSKEYQDLLQTDAAINPGNSGGPLVNLDGEVIGINTAIMPFAQGIGFAIPINVARKIKDELATRGKISRPYMGVYMQELTPDLVDYLKLPFKEGIVVSGTVEGSPAESAGLRKGDVIQEIDRNRVKTADEIRKVVQSHKAGEEIRLLVWRSGKQEVVTVKIGEMP
ncbi:MAG: trypsin-like peptidase domain-containing protein [Candidatus Eremiobacteraeota bacterium]|nr:trypsin-like peptidase domain-containing protein [Candidatus Eremiobacteraeota bacterium]